MTRWRIALVLVAAIAAAVPASAAKIGLSGGTSDPIPLTDPSWQLLTEENCLTDLNTAPIGYRCALYDGTGVGSFSSIDFRLKDGEGNLIPFPDSIEVDPDLSALETLTESPFSQGFIFRLSTDGSFSCLTCVFFSSHDNGLADPLYVSIFAVDGTVNVPEPALLLMLGPGAAYVLRRRRARAASRT